VQSIIPIGEGKAIRMTTAKYYTPSHRTIHENGVIPNIVATLTPTQEQQLAEWFSRDTLSPEERQRVENFTDPQLVRAVDAMKGALVYAKTLAKDDAPAAPAPTTAPAAGSSKPTPEAKPTEKAREKLSEKPADEKGEAPKPAMPQPDKPTTPEKPAAPTPTSPE
jgi:carboxyl-terminal processing protease